MFDNGTHKGTISFYLKINSFLLMLPVRLSKIDIYAISSMKFSLDNYHIDKFLNLSINIVNKHFLCIIRTDILIITR